MNRYVDEGFSISFGIDKSVFGDVEAEAVLMEIRAAKSPVVDIGIGGTIATSPIAHEGVVYFGACDKNFYAVDAETGKEVWRFTTNGPINASPTLHEGVLYFGSYDSTFYVLNLDGKLLWSFKTGDKIFSKPFVHKGAVYFGSWDKNFYALDAENGRLLWKFKTNGKILSWPVVCDDTIYFGSCDNNFFALNLDGTVKWRFRVGAEAGLFNSIVDNGMVYFGSFDGNVYAVKSDTGGLVWKFALSEPPNTVFCCSDGLLYFGSRNYNFYAISAKGRLVWEFKTTAILGGGVSLYDGVVYFNGSDGKLYAVDAKTGRSVWTFTANGFIGHTNPAIYNDRIYFGCWDCNLYCTTTGGELVWKFHTSLSYPAPIIIESDELDMSMETVWKPPEEETKAERAEEPGLSDYGEFSGTYISKEKTDYVSSRKKGYIK